MNDLVNFEITLKDCSVVESIDANKMITEGGFVRFVDSKYGADVFYPLCNIRNIKIIPYRG